MKVFVVYVLFVEHQEARLDLRCKRKDSLALGIKLVGLV